MPTHEYLCKSCKAKIEIKFPITQDPPESWTCDVCNSSMVKVFYPVGIIWKIAGVKCYDVEEREKMEKVKEQDLKARRGEIENEVRV